VPAIACPVVISLACEVPGAESADYRLRFETIVPLLEIVAVSKSYNDTLVLDDVSFYVDEGEIVCLLGPSGCGKTTMLRVIAGLEVADRGQVIFDGHLLDSVPVHRRGLGYMFQDLALFPHKDVDENVAFGLRMQDLPPAQIEARVSEMLTLVGLSGYDRRRVYELSGGEQQRVALARSLAPGPRVLMLDEPLASLDRALREELMNELRAILKRVGVTAIYVTHDQEEAFAVADRLVIMRLGQIVQQGAPQAIYRHPINAWIAGFLGLTNLVPGQVVALDRELDQEARPPLAVDTVLGRIPVPHADWAAPGQPVTVLLRPEAAFLVEEGTEPEGIIAAGTVVECSFRGGHCRLVLRHDTGLELAFALSSDLAHLPESGQAVALALRPGSIGLLAGEPDE
jgi:ABC-type Fe3+/spermidine/putrescine transport system ATPase subunit